MSADRAGGARDVATAAALVVDVVLGVGAGTQWVAGRLAYDAGLGHSIYRSLAGVSRLWIVAAVSLAGIALVLLLARGWRRASPIVAVAAAACVGIARCELFYAPWSIIVWHWRFRHGPYLVAIVRQGWEIAAMVSVVCALALMPLLITGGAPRRAPRSQGTAAWDTGGDLIVPRGLLIGWQDALTRGRE